VSAALAFEGRLVFVLHATWLAALLLLFRCEVLFCASVARGDIRCRCSAPRCVICFGCGRGGASSKYTAQCYGHDGGLGTGFVVGFRPKIASHHPVMQAVLPPRSFVTWTSQALDVAINRSHVV